eukprot:jgi/Chlat1/6358/Chrsp44S05822
MAMGGEAWGMGAGSVTSVGTAQAEQQQQQRASASNSAEAQPCDDVRLANLLRSRGKLTEALALYDRALASSASKSQIYTEKGTCLRILGRMRPALEALTQALNLDPNSAQALNQCGLIHKEQGLLMEAAYAYGKALAADPNMQEARENLAVVLTDLGTRLKLAGHVQEGVAKYYEALNIDPHYAPAYYNLGVVYSEVGQYDQALKLYQTAAHLKPLYAEAHCNLGVIHKNKGDLAAAIAAYERCLAIAPNFTIARNNLAIAYTDFGTKVKLEGRVQEGIAYYQKALVYNSQYPDALYNLGVAYGETAQYDKAIVMYELAVHFNPACAEAYNNLGVIHKDRENLDKAVECYQMALLIKPQFSQSLNNLGVVYTVQGKMDQALQMIQAAIAANPQYEEAYNNLGVLHRDAGNIPEAIAAYEQCLAIDPDSRNAGQNRLLALNYIQETAEDDVLYHAHKEWGDRFQRLFALCPPPLQSADRDRPITIGYVSPDFFTHSVSYFIMAPLLHHSYANFRIICYSAVVKGDQKTQKFREVVESRGGVWKEITGIDERSVAQLVQQDGVDILVELTGHTANNRLGTMACKPAPVQVTWIGYPNSSGLSTIDYRLTDAIVDSPETKQQFVEELIRLPGCFLCYTPAPTAPPVAPAPCLSCGFVTFGSFNNLAKMTRRVLALWGRILRSVPNSRLVLKCKPFTSPTVQRRFLSIMAEEGVDAVRIDLMPLMLLNSDHLNSYSLMDISLDTFPYAGTTTTCESLYMGVPCIALAGDLHAHNVGVTLLSQLGLHEHIAQSEDEYVDIAVSMAADIPALGNLRAVMRERMLSSRLCDGPNFTRDLERTYRMLWERWCNQQADKRAATPLAPAVRVNSPVIESPSQALGTSSMSSKSHIRTQKFGAAGRNAARC